MNLRNDWTKTTHMRAIDVWVILCHIGTFVNVLIYCAILFLLKMSPTEKITQKPSDLSEDDLESAQTDAKKERHIKRLIVARTIDIINKISIPLYMSTFPVIFFIVCIAQ